MSYLQRFNEKTGRKEFYIEPEGLPGYWTALGLCDRCYKYNKCLGLASLKEDEWHEYELENSQKKNMLIEAVLSGICS